MVLDSRQYAIWTELVKIFNVEPQEIGQKIPSLAATIQPVVDVLTAVAPAFTRADTIAAASPDSRTIATVPQDEYWMIYSMSIQRDSGDRTLNFTALEAPAGGFARCFLSVANVNAAGRRDLPLQVSLFIPPGSVFVINDSGGGVDSGWTLVTFRRELPVPL